MSEKEKKRLTQTKLNSYFEKKKHVKESESILSFLMDQNDKNNNNNSSNNNNKSSNGKNKKKKKDIENLFDVENFSENEIDVLDNHGTGQEIASNHDSQNDGNDADDHKDDDGGGIELDSNDTSQTESYLELIKEGNRFSQFRSQHHYIVESPPLNRTAVYQLPLDYVQYIFYDLGVLYEIIGSDEKIGLPGLSEILVTKIQHEKVITTITVQPKSPTLLADEFELHIDNRLILDDINQGIFAWHSLHSAVQVQDLLFRARFSEMIKKSSTYHVNYQPYCLYCSICRLKDDRQHMKQQDVVVRVNFKPDLYQHKLYDVFDYQYKQWLKQEKNDDDDAAVADDDDDGGAVDILDDKDDKDSEGSDAGSVAGSKDGQANNNEDNNNINKKRKGTKKIQQLEKAQKKKKDALAEVAVKKRPIKFRVAFFSQTKQETDRSYAKDIPFNARIETKILEGINDIVKYSRRAFCVAINGEYMKHYLRANMDHYNAAVIGGMLSQNGDYYNTLGSIIMTEPMFTKDLLTVTPYGRLIFVTGKSGKGKTTQLFESLRKVTTCQTMNPSQEEFLFNGYDGSRFVIIDDQKWDGLNFITILKQFCAPFISTANNTRQNIKFGKQRMVVDGIIVVVNEELEDLILKLINAYEQMENIVKNFIEPVERRVHYFNTVKNPDWMVELLQLVDRIQASSIQQEHYQDHIAIMRTMSYGLQEIGEAHACCSVPPQKYEGLKALVMHSQTSQQNQFMKYYQYKHFAIDGAIAISALMNEVLIHAQKFNGIVVCDILVNLILRVKLASEWQLFNLIQNALYFQGVKEGHFEKNELAILEYKMTSNVKGFECDRCIKQGRAMEKVLHVYRQFFIENELNKFNQMQKVVVLLAGIYLSQISTFDLDGDLDNIRELHRLSQNSETEIQLQQFYHEKIGRLQGYSNSQSSNVQLTIEPQQSISWQNRTFDDDDDEETDQQKLNFINIGGFYDWFFYYYMQFSVSENDPHYQEIKEKIIKKVQERQDVLFQIVKNKTLQELVRINAINLETAADIDKNFREQEQQQEEIENDDESNSQKDKDADVELDEWNDAKWDDI